VPGDGNRSWSSIKLTLLGERVWLEEFEKVTASKIAKGPRIGIDYGGGVDRKSPGGFGFKGKRVGEQGSDFRFLISDC
jgi:hypothetical protein